MPLWRFYYILYIIIIIIIIIKISNNMSALMYYMLNWNLFNVKMFINNSTLRTETIKFNTLPIPMQDSYSVHVIVNEQKLQTLNILCENGLSKVHTFSATNHDAIIRNSI